MKYFPDKINDILRKLFKNRGFGIKQIYALTNYSTIKRFINLTNLMRDYTLSKIIVHYPFALVIEPTNICNLKCPLCPTGMGEKGRDKGKISLTLFKSVIERLSNYIYSVELYNNGEPFLNKDIYEMISLCSERRLLTSLSSNFSIPLNANEISRIIESRLTYLYISLDGASHETYSQYRVNGNFEVVIENMKKIITEKKKLKSVLPFIEWQFLVFRHNEHEMERAKYMAKEIGADKISFAGAIMENMGKRTGENEKKEWCSENRKFQRGEEEKKCRWLWTHGVINWDGRVSPCCWAYYKKDDFGSILENDFFEIWNNDKFQGARRIFSEGPDYRSGTVCDSCIKVKNWRKSFYTAPH